jgi:GntR family transcriptional regulator, transcriptional repressor for pyruvate dehydrogenase complex
MSFEAVKTTRLFEEISRQIGEQIHSGKLKAGEKLPNERELAVNFAVSRHAVREALRSLESIGQLEFKKGATGGAFVAKGNPQPFTKIMRGMVEVGGITLEQLTEARLAVESSVIAVACARAVEADLKALDTNVESAERETLAGNLAVKTSLNVEFHVLLAELTGNPILIMMMKSLINILLDFISEVGSVMGVDVIKSRRRFLKHMRGRNTAKAVHEMEQHLRVLHDHYIRAANKKLRNRGRANG